MITLEKILETVQGDLDLSLQNRRDKFVQLHRIYYKLAKDLTSYTIKDIGELVKRDYSTVLHNINKFHLVERTKYIEVYYKCLDELTGSQKLVEYQNLIRENETDAVTIPKTLIDKLYMLDEKQLWDFEKTRLDPYIRMNVKRDKKN